MTAGSKLERMTLTATCFLYLVVGPDREEDDTHAAVPDLANHQVRPYPPPRPGGRWVQAVEYRRHVGRRDCGRVDEGAGFGVGCEQRADLGPEFRILAFDRGQVGAALGGRPLDRLLQEEFEPFPAFRRKRRQAASHRGRITGWRTDSRKKGVPRNPGDPLSRPMSRYRIGRIPCVSESSLVYWSGCRCPGRCPPRSLRRSHGRPRRSRRFRDRPERPGPSLLRALRPRPISRFARDMSWERRCRRTRPT